jgi:hypothetical protein
MLFSGDPIESFNLFIVYNSLSIKSVLLTTVKSGATSRCWLPTCRLTNVGTSNRRLCYFIDRQFVDDIKGLHVNLLTINQNMTFFSLTSPQRAVLVTKIPLGASFNEVMLGRWVAWFGLSSKPTYRPWNGLPNLTSINTALKWDNCHQ